MSKFTFYYGAMGSGKSLDLIRTAYNYKERGIEVAVLKPIVDTREGSGNCFISTRVGLTFDANWLESGSEQELKDIYFSFKTLPKVILVDEAQFLTKEQVMIMKNFSYEYEVPFIFYGLKVNFQGEQFEGTRALISFSEKTEELITMCSCGKVARQNARVVNGKIIRKGDEVVIEGEAEYVPLCNRCYLTKEDIYE